MYVVHLCIEFGASWDGLYDFLGCWEGVYSSLYIFVELGEISDHSDLVAVLFAYEECWAAPIRWGGYWCNDLLFQQILYCFVFFLSDSVRG